MDGTTINEMGANQVPHNEEPRSESHTQPKPDPLQPVFKTLRDVWHVGLGMVVLAGEGGARLIKTAAAKGREVEPNLREPMRKAGESVSDAANEMGSKLKEVGQSIGRGAGKLEHMVDQRISRTVAELATPLQEELKTLNVKVEELKAKLDDLRAQQRASTPPSEGPVEPPTSTPD